jgi:hypothetical protein
VCDNKIETVFKIKKELEPLYAKLVYSQLDQFGHHTLEGIERYLHKGCIFWDIVNRYVLYGDDEKYREDNQKIKTKPLKDLDYFALTYVLKGFVEQKQNDPFNFDASMVLYGYKGNMYVQFFGLSGYVYLDDIFGDYFKGLVKNGVLADYHYQDQSDDEDEDNPDWEERGDMWDELYDGYDTSAQVGFSYEFFSIMQRILFEYGKKRTGETDNHHQRT